MRDVRGFEYRWNALWGLLCYEMESIIPHSTDSKTEAQDVMLFGFQPSEPHDTYNNETSTAPTGKAAVSPAVWETGPPCVSSCVPIQSLRPPGKGPWTPAGSRLISISHKASVGLSALTGGTLSLFLAPQWRVCPSQHLWQQRQRSLSVAWLN